MATDSLGTEPDLGVLCTRVEVLEPRAGSAIQSDSYLRNRVRELEWSERSLLLQLYHRAFASQLPSMQHSQRLDQRLYMLREEVRNMSQEKERGERAWRERLQRCQRQLKAKEEEMSRQSQYFENFKAQLQQKLSLARDREQSLQNRIYTLEKQLLDMTVSAATGRATIRAVRITAGTVTHLEEQDRLPSMRGEGEGEEEKKKEEKRKQWLPILGIERKERREGDEGKSEKDIEGGRNKHTKQTSNEARLQGFIISLQEDLKVLLEREEDRMAERRGLLEQLQEAQENSHFQGCQVEEMKAKLKLSKSSLMEEVEELREENRRLQPIIRDAANQTPSQLSTVTDSTCSSPGTTSPSCRPAICSVPSNTLSYGTAMGQSSAESSGEAAAERTQNNIEHHSSSGKSETLDDDPLNLFHHFGSKLSTNLQSLSLTAGSFGEFKLGNWCSKGILNLEDNPSEECDALREAYKSLGLGEDLQALREQREHLEVSLQHTQEQLQVMLEENTQLKLQLRKQAEEQQTETEQRSSREKVSTPPTCDGDDQLQISPPRDDTVLAQDDLVQALNQENRALADRIQELLAHVELREEEVTKQETQLREHISRLEEDGVRMEQENQEQGCLVSELTKKTDDDLNTIMELQQKLEESREDNQESQGQKQPCRVRRQSPCTAAITESFPPNNPEECVDSLVESVLKGKEAQLMFSQETNTLTTVSASGWQHDNHCISLQNSSRSSLKVRSLTDQMVRLTSSVQSLKTEQEELTGSINSLREQQREAALSVQTQTEEKQQLTRTVWGLKEEKDCICQSLASLKQDKEQLNRTVCGLKDERDQFIRSISGLKEEKEQLTKSLSSLERDKEVIMESLSSGKEERDQIMQSLQTESDRLSQAILHLKQDRDTLTYSIKSLTEERDQEQLSDTLKEERDRFIKSVSSLKEEKGRTEHSISCLKIEEKQIMEVIQGLKEERNGLHALPIQTQAEEKNRRQQLLNPGGAGTKKNTESLAGTGNQRCETNTHRGNITEEQSDLMREIEALGAELKQLREELDKSHVEIKRLHGELCQAEDRREEAERKAARAADKVVRLTDAANQMEETRKENDSLTTQAKELQSELTNLLREKTNAMSLKAQMEEQYKVITAQLKAKTVALEELNSEYIALKRGQGRRDELSTVLVSLRARYNDIRAKHDALLKRKSKTDLDIPPLKAKLSCLVGKCQERNSLLVQLMKAMHRQGCVDPKLTQRAEHLLSDAALQDYTVAFAPGSNIHTRDYCTGFTPEFISKFQDYTGGLFPDRTCAAVSTSVNKQQQNGVTPESGGQCRKSEEHIITTDSSTHLQDCSRDVTLAATGTLKKNANSPVPNSPLQELASAQVSASQAVAQNRSLIANAAQLSPSASGPVQATSQPETFGFHHPDMKGKSSPDPSSLTGSSLSPPPPSSSTCVSLSRRLSSPEKILNLHEQLQKTLMSSYQAPESRGRGQQPRRSLSLSVPADLNSASQTNKQNLSFNILHPNSVPVTAAWSQAKHTPITTKPAATNKSATLFNAVASRSAHATFSPNMFTNHRLKADIPKSTSSALASSSNFAFATMSPRKAESISSSGTNNTVSLKPTKKIPSVPDLSDATHTALTTLTLRTTTFNSDATHPKNTASDATAPNLSTAPKADISNMTSKMDGAYPAYDGSAFTSSCTQSAHCSSETSNRSARKFTAAREKTKTARPKPEAPAEVCSVEVIKTVGQSSLMIGWERPPLDELGCSNGTYVYGYRVFVDGDFHKSVMSSACTKCILENVDLSFTVHVSVQTLGSNGLSSNSVHTVYRTSVSTDQP
ncbi:trichohyalin-like [Brachyistius frenatus]|uniref:trichohyalin-like n=1 Tax=Brachyistius frenatus TaxID=100188 RepID=UPI0037E89E57